MRVPFIDLQSQYAQIKKPVERSWAELIRRGDFILGRDVAGFETAFADFCGARFAVGLNSGTDALFLGLLSLGIGPGDEVIVPAFTYIASAFAVSYTGGLPVFVDIDEKTFTINPEKIAAAVTKKTCAIMPVHLYGQAADMRPILAIAKKYNLKIVEDAAQAHGASYQMTGKKRVGSIGDVGAFSFYPTKNLGALGDGGMAVTNDEKIFAKLKKLRDYGRRDRYEHISLGYNSRLDSLQAVFLKEKLKRLKDWNKKRAAAAGYYRRLLDDCPQILLPQEADYAGHVWHIFAVRIKNRDKVLAGLKEAGISAMVHYPIPLHLQKVYRDLGGRRGDFPAAERLSAQVLCLPIYPHIKKEQIEYVARILKKLI